jgi:hypothetical protein
MQRNLIRVMPSETQQTPAPTPGVRSKIPQRRRMSGVQDGRRPMTQAVGSVKDPARQGQPQDISAGRAFDDAKTPGRTVRTWFSSGRSCMCPDLSGPKHTKRLTLAGSRTLRRLGRLWKHADTAELIRAVAAGGGTSAWCAEGVLALTGTFGMMLGCSLAWAQARGGSG